jgi:hypothetical protein
MELGMTQTDEIVRLKLQVLQQANFLRQAQELLVECNKQRSWYKNEHGKCLTLLREILKRVLPPTKSQKTRIAALLTNIPPEL